MSTEEDLKKKEDDSSEEIPPLDDDSSSISASADEDSDGASAMGRPRGTGAASTQDRTDRNTGANAENEDVEAEEFEDDGGSPAQLGSSRFVYAAYFGGAIAIAFLVSKLGSFVWTKLSAWKPTVGEPHDEIVMPIAGLIGAAAAVYYWKRTRARQLVEEVADELSKVTWPSKQEVTNGTAVVLVTTALATIFFALMDRFWGFVTNLVYGT